MRLSNAVYTEDYAGYPFLEILVDGHPARIGGEQKFLHLDVVFLGADWEDRVDPIDIPAEPERMLNAITVHGHVKDARLAQMVREYEAACDSGAFRPGPVKIPPASKFEETE